MPLFQLVFLAIIQGITEFIPVSSSAHLILPAYFLDEWEDQGALIDIAVHLGSLGAVLLYFRHDTVELCTGGLDAVRFRNTPACRLFLLIVSATIPLLAAGIALKLLALDGLMRSPLLIGIASIIFAIFLYVADKKPARITENTALTWRAILTIGLAQALALIPGTSRSGVTITAARFLGLARPQAARFSMLLAVPAILAFSLAAGLDVATGNYSGRLRDLIVVIILSFIAAYGSIFVFMRLTARISFTPFVIYRIILGGGVIAATVFTDL